MKKRFKTSFFTIFAALLICLSSKLIAGTNSLIFAGEVKAPESLLK